MSLVLFTLAAVTLPILILVSVACVFVVDVMYIGIRHVVQADGLLGYAIVLAVSIVLIGTGILSPVGLLLIGLSLVLLFDKKS